MFGEHGGMAGGIAGTRAGGLRNLFYPKRKGGVGVGAPYLQIQSSDGKAVYLWDVKKTSAGHLIVLLETYSQSLLGISLSAYTDGSTYPAIGLLKIDPNTVKNDGSLGWLLGSYWLTGKPSGQAIRWLCHTYEKRLEIDTNDNAYFLCGPYEADSFTLPYHKIIKVNTSNMSYVAMSAPYIQPVNYNFALFSIYDGYVYGAFDSAQIWATRRIRTQTTFASGWEDATWGDPRFFCFGLRATQNGMFGWDPNHYKKLRKSALDFSAESSVGITSFAVGKYDNIRLVADGSSYLYLSGSKNGALATIRVEKRNQSNLAETEGFSAFEKAYTSGKTINTHIAMLIPTLNRYMIAGNHNDGAVGASDPFLFTVNSDTGAEALPSKFIEYSDGSPIQATAGKTMAPYGAVDNGDGTAWVVGYLNTALRGYANEGGIYDGFLVKLNVATGRIIDQ